MQAEQEENSEVRSDEEKTIEEVPTKEPTELVYTKSGRNGFTTIDPSSIPPKTASVIRWTVVSSVEYGQITSKEVYERVRQLKRESPDSAVVGEEEVITELSVTEETGFFTQLLHGDPNIYLNFRNTRHPKYVVE